MKHPGHSELGIIQTIQSSLTGRGTVDEQRDRMIFRGGMQWRDRGRKTGGQIGCEDASCIAAAAS
jgi:hypothetical protein